MNYFATFDQNKPFSYTYISTMANPIDMIQSAVYLSYLALNFSYFCRPSHKVFVKLSKPHFFHLFLHGAGHEIQISYSCQKCILNMCILSYIYGSHSLELGEDIELFCVVQDFCLVTVTSHWGDSTTNQLEWVPIVGLENLSFNFIKQLLYIIRYLAT